MKLNTYLCGKTALYKGHRYEIVAEAVFYDPILQHWTPCVIYRCKKRTFVRKSWDFRMNFTIVEEEGEKEV